MVVSVRQVRHMPHVNAAMSHINSMSSTSCSAKRLRLHVVQCGTCPFISHVAMPCHMPASMASRPRDSSRVQSLHSILTLDCIVPQSFILCSDTANRAILLHL